MRNPRVLIGLLSLIVLTGGAAAIPFVRDETHWQWANLTGESESLSDYLAAWPNGRHAARAAEMLDDRAWSAADQAGTADAVTHYLTLQPNGRHARSAAQRLEDIDWTKARSAGTAVAIDGFLREHTSGRHVGEATARKAELLASDAPFDRAVQAGDRAAINQFLSDFPGHKREAEARAALEDAGERDIADLLKAHKIEVKVTGTGIESVSLEIRNLTSHGLTARIPPGTFFVSRNASAQNMVATAAATLFVKAQSTADDSIEAACANAPRAVPTEDDTFTVQASPAQRELFLLMPALAQTNVDYPIRQAAVWIITDNASFLDLGELVAGGSRAINEPEAARAMQIIELAGLDIRKRVIWRDRALIADGLPAGDLKTWLKGHPP